MNVEALIAKRLAAPKSYKVVTTYADGKTREHLTETLAQANVHKAGASQAIGRKLLNRETGLPVMVVSVEVYAL